MTRDEILEVQAKMLTAAWRKESFPRRLLTGRNWAFCRHGIAISFDEPALRTYPIQPNDPDTDTCLEWLDGYVSVLRTENEPTFRDSPPRLGKARVGTGAKARGNGSKKRKR